MSNTGLMYRLGYAYPKDNCYPVDSIEPYLGRFGANPRAECTTVNTVFQQMTQSWTCPTPFHSRFARKCNWMPGRDTLPGPANYAVAAVRNPALPERMDESREFWSNWANGGDYLMLGLCCASVAYIAYSLLRPERKSDFPPITIGQPTEWPPAPSFDFPPITIGQPTEWPLAPSFDFPPTTTDEKPVDGPFGLPLEPGPFLLYNLA